MLMAVLGLSPDDTATIFKVGEYLPRRALWNLEPR